MEKTAARNTRLWAFAALGAAALIVCRKAVLALLMQLSAAYLLVGLALPLCRLLESRVKPGTAAAFSLGAVALGAAALLLCLVPLVAGQVRQLSASLPGVIRWCGEKYQALQNWLFSRGINLAPVESDLLGRLTQGAGVVAKGVARGLQQAASSMSTVVLSPLLAFYLLRDRRRVASFLTLMFPVRYRACAVRAVREMRRETAGYLRGQLLVSLFVGLMTALGLTLVGTPGSMLLGVLMGLMEMVPYVGPWIAGVPAVLLSLQHGLPKALWTVGVLFVVQQTEGTLLSPRLMSGCTRLHPAVVLLAISAGGVLGGAWGMMLALPCLVSIRGAVRGARA